MVLMNIIMIIIQDAKHLVVYLKQQNIVRKIVDNA